MAVANEHNRSTPGIHRPRNNAGLLANALQGRIAILGANNAVWNWQMDHTYINHYKQNAVQILVKQSIHSHKLDCLYLAQAFRVWDSKLGEWLQNTAIHNKTADGREFAAQFRAAYKRSGKGLILLYGCETLYDLFGKANTVDFLATTLPYAWYMLVGEGDAGLESLDLPVVLNPRIIDAEEHNMNLHELQVYYTCSGIVLSEQRSKELHALLGGWTLGALLLSKYLKHGEPLESRDIDIAIDGLFLELDEKLLANLDTHEFYAAVLFSEFDTFSYELAGYICPYSVAVIKNCLRKLPGTNFSERGKEIEIHPLIRRYWQTKKYDVPKKLRDGSQSRAAHWYRANRKYENALQCAIDARDYGLTRAILAELNLQRRYKDAHRYAAILAQLEDSVLESQPMLWAYKVVAYYTAHNYSAGKDEKEALETYLALCCETLDEKQAKGEMLVLSAFLCFGTRQQKDYFVRAAKYLDDKGSEIWDGRKNDFIINGVLLPYTGGYSLTLNDANQLQHETAPYLYKAMRNWGRGYCHLATAEYAFLTGDLQLVFDSSNEAIREGLAYQQYDVAAMAHFHQLLYYISLGMVSEGLSAWRSVHIMAAHKKNEENILCDLADATVYLTTRQLHRLPFWVHSSKTFLTRCYSNQPSREYFLRAIYLWQKGQLHTAVSTINEGLGMLLYSDQWIMQQRLLVLLVVVQYALKTFEQMKKTLYTVYKTSSSQGIYMHFAEFCSPICEVLRYCLRQKATTDALLPPAKWMLDTIRQAEEFEKGSNAFHDGYYNHLQERCGVKLTAKEYAVLELACMGTPHAAIAKQMNVTYNYVNAVIQRICKKFRVVEFDEAIILGRTMGIQEEAFCLNMDG